jgi:hypothetical protein
MKQKRESLHLTLGENAGIMLMEVAQETLIYSLNPEKALSTIKDVLIGCPEQLALEVLVGRKVIVVNDDQVSVSVVDREPCHSDYPLLDPVKWSDERKEKLLKDAGELADELFDVMKEISEENGHFEISVDILDYVRQYETGNLRSFLDEIREYPEIDRVFEIIAASRNFTHECYNALSVFRFLASHYDNHISCDTDEMENLLSLIVNRSNMLLTSNLNAITAAVTVGMPGKDNRLEQYLESALSIQKTIENGIKPVQIIYKYDAGWLSPNGDYYGLNGEIANMLHIQIADALQEIGIVPKNIDGHNPDSWLSCHGWVKIHHDHILYDGYYQAAFGMELIPLTEIQIKKIALYGNTCYGGILRFGFSMERRSAALFESCDESVRARLLDYQGVNK